MENTKNYDILDLAKFVLSIMIVAIHTQLFPTLLSPWLRLAVPLFFIISSFLLFTKVNNSPKSESGNIVKKFMLRNAKLYLFWFVVLLPFTIYFKAPWFSSGFWSGIYTFIKNALFSSTFVASWFITATITATFIIYKLSKKLNYKILFIIFTLVYFVCCIVSSYSIFFKDIAFINKLYDIYLIFFPSPVLSFPSALIWVLIGKMFADGNIKREITNKRWHLLFVVISSILLFIEWKCVDCLTAKYDNDCYFFLIPLAILIFKSLLNMQITLKNAKLLRKISTITYPLHASIARVFLSFNDNFYAVNTNILGLFNFSATLLCCYIACYIIFKLENKKYFKILKYSH